MIETIKSCDICNRFISRIRGRRMHRRRKPAIKHDRWWFPSYIHICKKCQELPQVKKLIQNYERRIKSNEVKKHRIYDEFEKLRKDFKGSIVGLRQDYIESHKD